MDINAINNLSNVGSSYSAPTTADAQPAANKPAVNTEPSDQTKTSVDLGKSKQETAKEDVRKFAGAMNQLVESMNSNIHFKLDQKTNVLMVQVVDQTSGKVIKEFPPQEFLDTIAAIRDYVGILVDKKI